MRDILLNANPETLRWIEFNAGTSNDIILSPEEAVLAKAMIQEAEWRMAKSLATASHVERLRIALAPHKAVPAEVLVIIFQYAKGSSTFLVNFDPGKYALLRLSHVCSRWRTVCRSEPSFWNDAVFHLRGREDEEAADVKFWIDNFIVDSYPLSLRINMEDFLVDLHPLSLRIGGRDLILGRSHPEPLHLLLSLRNSICRLEINEAKYLLGMPKHSFPLLEDLSIQLAGNDLNLFQRSECFVGMGNLRTVKFSLLTRCVSLAEAKLPWSQLTTLMIGFTERREFLSIEAAVKLLEQCKNLKKCNISVKNSNMPCTLTARLPNLTDLVLMSSRYDRDNMYSLIGCLIMPSLVTLTMLTNMIQHATVVEPDLGYLENNSARSIHTLILQSRSVLSTDTDLKLEEQPCLKTLKAPTTVLSDETMNKIAEGILLPDIQTLTVVIRSIESLEHLANLVEQKASSSLLPILCINTMVIETVEKRSLKPHYIRRRLERIKACGSKVTLRYIHLFSSLVTCFQDDGSISIWSPFGRHH